MNYVYLTLGYGTLTLVTLYVMGVLYIHWNDDDRRLK